MRRSFTGSLLAMCVACAFAGATGSAAAAATLPAEGVFENCALDTAMPSCVSRLATMHAGGVNVVVIAVGSGSPDNLAAYAASAHALGMSVMWETSNPGWWQEPSTSTNMAGSLGGFASACGCNQNGPLLDYMIHFLGALPGTYGYYAADDTMLSPGDGPGVARYSAQIKRDDPAHTIMIGSADQSQTDTYQRSTDLVGAEVYPVTTSSLMPISRNQDSWANIAQTAIDTQHSADRAGQASAFILQAFTWGDNLSDGIAIGVCSSRDTQASCHAQLRYPSAGDQLQLRNEILAHAHPKLILWWSFPGTFGQAGDDTYSLYPSGDVAAARWQGLSNAIQAPWPSARTARTTIKAQAARVSRARRAARTRRTRRVMRARRHRARLSSRRFRRGSLAVRVSARVA